jgi:hypothetical protein
MKNYISYFASLLIIAMFIVSCDYVNNVVDPNAPIIPGNRKVLIEDYTGHKCGNCPAAAYELTRIENKYPGKIIPIAVHAGYFSNAAGTYSTNFQTVDGTAYDTRFGNSGAGNPNGLINRIGFPNSQIKQWTSWESEASKMLAQQAKFEIKIKNSFNIGGSILTSSITVKALAKNTGTYKLVVVLTEDSIIAEQLDYSLPTGSQFITNYRFNHVLRGSINSTWGDVVTGVTNLNDSIVVPYTKAINVSYNPDKCHVVAYIYDADANSPTYYEVLQAEELKLK